MIVVFNLFLAPTSTLYFSREFLLNMVAPLEAKSVTSHAAIVLPNRPLPLPCNHIRIHWRA